MRLSTTKIGSALMIAFCASLLGIGLTASPWGQSLSEHYELDWLFALRGPREAPPESLIVTINQHTSDALGLKFDPKLWPRNLHAQLVSGLNRAGARSVVFDLHFLATQPGEDDEFARAMSDAGNVLLPEHLAPCSPAEENCASNPMHLFKNSPKVTIYQRTRPTAALASAAAAIGPFTLPDSNRRVSQFSTLDRYAGDAPSLALLTLIHYTSREPGIQKYLAQGHFAGPVPSSTNALTETLLQLSRRSDDTPNPSQRHGDDDALAAALDAVSPPNTRYLNFAGPSKSIQTIDYAQALQLLSEPQSTVSQNNFHDKAIFVGVLDKQSRQRNSFDYFDTVYSDTDTGSKLSGVEILATSFNNLLHRSYLRPTPGGVMLLVIITWSIIIALSARLFKPIIAIAVVIALCAGYLMLAASLFTNHQIWLTLLSPIAIQAPLILFVAILLHYREAAREYTIIKEAFSHYLPDVEIKRLAHQSAKPSQNRETLFGICLFTDAEGYTSVAETLPSDQLTSVEEDYKKIIRDVIEDHGGCISDAHGDSVLAFWVAHSDDPAQREAACRAMIDIDNAIAAWNKSNRYGIRFPTRIGLHCGELTLTRTGSDRHLIGDIVNTASRLEAFNKHLGTKRLASAETLSGLDEVVSQYLGRFVFKGKVQRVEVHRVLGYGEQDRQAWTAYQQYFSAAVEAFQAARWDDAVDFFESVLTIRPDDAPAVWYLEQTKTFRGASDTDKQLKPTFDGIVFVNTKSPED